MSEFEIIESTRAGRVQLAEVLSTSDGLAVRIGAAPDFIVLRCDILEAALSQAPFTPGDAVLVLELPGGDDRGVVLGRVRPASGTLEVDAHTPIAAHAAVDTPESLVLEAKTSLVLRVGDGSIEIRADGKILIKGSDLVSHAKRMNRIKGGAVAIN